NGAEPWSLPSLKKLPNLKFECNVDPETYQPYQRDVDTLSRPWVTPGMPGLEHRIGGLEKENLTGNVSYDPHNHHFMCETRAEKVRRVQNEIPPCEVLGDQEGLLVIGWGSTYGAIRAATQVVRDEGTKVGHLHLRNINPLPADLGEVIARYDKVLIPEMNLGQLIKLVRAEFLIDAIPLHKLHGQPFLTREIAAAIRENA
ncbi:MAG: 2-oxoglutarate ferredoxin oxidoreductase subunit alpha, partial [Rhodobacterales bacterium]|nr:2-oxoglutarate ferredoxin oxidoreductase subunit alpha [Rhodobacterales bacterium]